MRYRELQDKLALFRDEGLLPEDFRLNQKGRVLHKYYWGAFNYKYRLSPKELNSLFEEIEEKAKGDHSDWQKFFISHKDDAYVVLVKNRRKAQELINSFKWYSLSDVIWERTGYKRLTAKGIGALLQVKEVVDISHTIVSKVNE